MTNIVYGKSLNPVGKDNAKSRRNARRAEEAIKAREIEAILSAAIGGEAPSRQKELSRAEIACQRKPSMRAEAVTITTMVQKNEGSTCLPDVAKYAAGYRKSKDIVTAR